MFEDYIIPRVVLIIISIILITVISKRKFDSKIGNQLFGIFVIFWSTVIIISIEPRILDDILLLSGLENRSQFLLILSIIVLSYSLYTQISKNKNLYLDFNRVISEIAISNFQQSTNKINDSISLIIPAYNEVNSLPEVLENIPDSILDIKISKIVIDDGSSDETYKVAILHNAYCLKHESNLGQGSAILTGLNFVSKHSPKVIVTFDADGQHDIHDLENLIKPILSKDCDMTVGSRFIGSQEYANTERLIGIHFFTNLINFLCKSNISDCTNGLRAFSPLILLKIQLREKNFSAPEILIETILKGFKIQNISTTIKSRIAGHTKKPRLRFAFGLFRVILITWLRNKV
jgi:hypothetical protein